jgi:hypothetical protein
MNTEEFKDIRQAAVDTIRERNPSAFEPKIKNGKVHFKQRVLSSD